MATLSIEQIFPPSFDFSDERQLTTVISELHNILLDCTTIQSTAQQQLTLQQLPSTRLPSIPKNVRNNMRVQGFALYNLCTTEPTISPTFRPQLLLVAVQMLLLYANIPFQYFAQVQQYMAEESAHKRQTTGNKQPIFNTIRVPEGTAQVLIKAYLRTIRSFMDINDFSTSYHLFYHQLYHIWTCMCGGEAVMDVIKTKMPEQIFMLYHQGMELMFFHEFYSNSYDFAEQASQMLYIISQNMTGSAKITQLTAKSTTNNMNSCDDECKDSILHNKPPISNSISIAMLNQTIELSRSCYSFSQQLITKARNQDAIPWLKLCLSLSPPHSFKESCENQANTQKSSRNTPEQRESRLYRLLALCYYELQQYNHALPMVNQSISLYQCDSSLFLRARLLYNVLELLFDCNNTNDFPPSAQSVNDKNISNEMKGTINNTKKGTLLPQKISTNDVPTDPNIPLTCIEEITPLILHSVQNINNFEMCLSLLNFIPFPSVLRSYNHQLSTNPKYSVQTTDQPTSNKPKEHPSITLAKTIYSIILARFIERNPLETTDTPDKSTVNQLLLTNHCYLQWLLLNNLYSDALALLANISSLSADSMKILWSICSHFLEQANYSSTITWALSLIRLIPSNDYYNLIMIYLILAQCYYHLQQYSHTISTAQYVLTLIPKAHEEESYIAPFPPTDKNYEINENDENQPTNANNTVVDDGDNSIHLLMSSRQEKNKTTRKVMKNTVTSYTTQQSSITSSDFCENTTSRLVQLAIRAHILLIRSFLQRDEPQFAIDPLQTLFKLSPDTDFLCLIVEECQERAVLLDNSPEADISSKNTNKDDVMQTLETIQIKSLGYMIPRINSANITITMLIALSKLQARSLLRTILDEETSKPRKIGESRYTSDNSLDKTSELDEIIPKTIDKRRIFSYLPQIDGFINVIQQLFSHSGGVTGDLSSFCNDFVNIYINASTTDDHNNVPPHIKNNEEHFIKSVSVTAFATTSIEDLLAILHALWNIALLCFGIHAHHKSYTLLLQFCQVFLILFVKISTFSNIAGQVAQYTLHSRIKSKTSPSFDSSSKKDAGDSTNDVQSPQQRPFYLSNSDLIDLLHDTPFKSYATITLTISRTILLLATCLETVYYRPHTEPSECDENDSYQDILDPHTFLNNQSSSHNSGSCGEIIENTDIPNVQKRKLVSQSDTSLSPNIPRSLPMTGSTMNIPVAVALESISSLVHAFNTIFAHVPNPANNRPNSPSQPTIQQCYIIPTLPSTSMAVVVTIKEYGAFEQLFFLSSLIQFRAKLYQYDYTIHDNPSENIANGCADEKNALHNSVQLNSFLSSLPLHIMSLESYDLIIAEALHVKNYYVAQHIIQLRLKRTVLGIDCEVHEFLLLYYQLIIIVLNLIQNNTHGDGKHKNNNSNEQLGTSFTTEVILQHYQVLLNSLQQYFDQVESDITTIALQIKAKTHLENDDDNKNIMIDCEYSKEIDTTDSPQNFHSHNVSSPKKASSTQKTQSNNMAKNDLTSNDNVILEHYDLFFPIFQHRFHPLIRSTEAHTIIKLIYNHGVQLFYSTQNFSTSAKCFEIAIALRELIVVKTYSILHHQKIFLEVQNQKDDCKITCDDAGNICNNGINPMISTNNIFIQPHKIQTFTFAQHTFILKEPNPSEYNVMRNALTTIKSKVASHDDQLQTSIS